VRSYSDLVLKRALRHLAHPRLTWRLFPGLVQDANRHWTWPGRPWLPLAVSLRATRG